MQSLGLEGYSALGTLAALPEHLRSISRTHTAAHNRLLTPVLGDPSPSSGTQTYAGKMPIHRKVKYIKVQIFFKKLIGGFRCLGEVTAFSCVKIFAALLLN